MLYHLLAPLASTHIIFNLFNYITFRLAAGMATAIVLSFVLGPPIIRRLRRLRVGQVVRSEGPETHLGKAGTPTMGGVLIITSAVIATLLWARLDNAYTIISLVVLLALGGIGFLDDYLKVVRRRTEGLVGRYKLVGQALVGLGVGTYIYLSPLTDMPAGWTTLPFFADLHIEIWGLLFIPWVMFIMAAESNAVNLTDGLDGLAGGLCAIAAMAFALFAYVMGRVDTSQYLGLFYLPGAGELAIFCVAVSGATLGFLWYNSHPAELFMGDTGSLALGGMLATTAILLKNEFLLPIIGGVFVAEALSVTLQVSWFKYTKRRFGEGRRLLRMAPLHHHFEKSGWPESKIIMRFWILGILCTLIGLSTMKVR
jgi:phospho-N-acetylmuramoyl-pentapeptide-transferase